MKRIVAAAAALIFVLSAFCLSCGAAYKDNWNSRSRKTSSAK